MKKLLLALLVFLSEDSMASAWQPVCVSSTVSCAIDSSSIVMDGKYRKAWVLWNFSETQTMKDYRQLKFLSMKELSYFDCETNKSTTIQRLYYSELNGSGDMIDSANVRFSPTFLIDVVPDSLGEVNLKFVCSKILNKKQKPSDFKY